MEDIELAYGLWTDARVRHFLFDDRIISRADACSLIEASLVNFERCGYGLWLAFTREGRCLIGFAGCLRPEGEAPSLIYGVQPDCWGKGYATEAAGAVLRYALESLAVPLVKADVDEPNVTSVRVLEKLGMRRTGCAIVAGRPLIYYEGSRSRRVRSNLGLDPTPLHESSCDH